MTDKDVKVTIEIAPAAGVAKK